MLNYTFQFVTLRCKRNNSKLGRWKKINFCWSGPKILLCSF